ncbi:hypothetical protein AVEN_147585-1 [Araneus ventricosus]|uniref:Uncharacterized protein n=1 Tax=Araneus ventricosus TaxID=182803 RepID=A0A4Y2H1T3_ARAVE|nr:hypothetical protein AVEN_147585-1 [Araneus ventricosus]
MFPTLRVSGNLVNLRQVLKVSGEEEEFLENILCDDVADAIWSWCFYFEEMMDDSRDFSFGEWAVVWGVVWDELLLLSGWGKIFSNMS